LPQLHIGGLMQDGDSAVAIRNGGAAAPWLLVCEHASNRFPGRWGTLGLPIEAQSAHIAWDPGAAGLAEGLADRLGAPLVSATVSRLVYDCNRPPDAPGAMAERSEVWEIPGNRGLAPAERLARTAAVYLPFHAAVASELGRLLAAGIRPVLVTVHSFTPVWFGAPRAVELGAIHDADPAFARLVVDAAHRRTALRTELNAPYSAADGVAHTLKLHATPHGLRHVMLEIRNDLIADASSQARMADTLAAVLAEAAAEAEAERKGVA
jgi:predicted N-formylglutamate amidohydrolase